MGAARCAFVLFHNRLQLERDNSKAGPGSDSHAPASVPLACVSCRVYLHLSTPTLLVSAQAMDNYTTEATELVETYGLSPLSSVTPRLIIPLQTFS